MPAPPAFPERSLRALLAAAVAAWCQPRTADPSAEDEPRRIYVDGFAGGEFRFGTGIARAEGCATRASELLAVLRAHPAEAPAAALLVDEDPAQLQRIYTSLEELVDGEAIHTGEQPPLLGDGELGLVEAPFAAVAAGVARVVAQRDSLLWLAPPSARELPWAALEPLLADPAATVLLRLPHSDFIKQAQHTSPLADLPGFARRMVEGCSALLGDPRHAWLAQWRAAGDGPDAALARVADAFTQRLAERASGRAVRQLRVVTPAGAPLWLVLITPHPAVSLALNAALRAEGLTDLSVDGPVQTAVPPPADAPPPALELFCEAAPEPAAASAPRAPTAAQVAAGLLHRFAGQRVAWVDVLMAYASAAATLPELRAGLARLRRRGEAEYQGRLGTGAEIVFHHARPDPPRRRARPAGLDLFAPAEGECGAERVPG